MNFSLLGIIFLFISSNGQYLENRASRSLSQGEVMCKEDTECQKKFGSKSKCENNVCACFGEGGLLTSCPKSMSEIQIQSSLERQFEPDAVSFIGRPCGSNNDCRFAYAVCNATKQCDCQGDYVYTPDGKYCLKGARKLGDFCQHDIQCTHKFGNSSCLQKQCQCLENYHDAALQCFKSIGFEEKCDDHRECWHMYARCNDTNHVCVCDGRRVINSRRTLCLDIVQHRERCFETAQCTASLGPADCIQGYCFCARNHHYVSFRQKCIPSKTLGQPCDEDDECYQTSRNDDRNFLICAHAKVCICSNGFERIGYQCVEKENGSSAVTLYTSALLLMSMLVFLL